MKTNIKTLQEEVKERIDYWKNDKCKKKTIPFNLFRQRQHEARQRGMEQYRKAFLKDIEERKKNRANPCEEDKERVKERLLELEVIEQILEKRTRK